MSRKYHIGLSLLIFMLVHTLGRAEVNSSSVTSRVEVGLQIHTEPDSVLAVTTADTGESLLFLGRKLAFEAKKRLNLTTEEEEKEEEKKKDFTLRFFGITYERK